ncbi:MAG TPA: beta-glucosidase [Acidimicrobiaceae bacterium]|nr:beta-glucosidase [Acidimicrobiaceae bacterium]
MTMISRAQFGTEFAWGVATAAYQIEGAWDRDGKGPSIWDEFTHGRGPFGIPRIKDNATGDVATDSYDRVEEDIALVAAMGFTAYRFSISWPRVIPGGIGPCNEVGIEYYSRVVDSCLAAGIEPWVTLYHWDLPAALEARGGWTNPEVVSWFVEYVTVVVDALGDRVSRWMLFNEPLSFTVLGYLLGVHAPGRRGLKSFCDSVHHVHQCTARGAEAIRAHARRSPVVGSTHYLSPVLASGSGPLSRIAETNADALINGIFLEPTAGRGYPAKLPTMLSSLARRGPCTQELQADLDFLGVQYYTRLRTPWLPVPGLWTIPLFGRNPELGVTSLGWEIRPEGLGMVLDRVHSYGAFPEVVVTEGGASFDDRLVNRQPGDAKVVDADHSSEDGPQESVHDQVRIRYYERHLAEVAAAQRRGVPVSGYFCWSLMDNFEWTFGYRPRFGLVYVDYETQRRVIKDSGKWFGSLLGGTARLGTARLDTARLDTARLDASIGDTP